jgi:hypothetical protein
LKFIKLYFTDRKTNDNRYTHKAIRDIINPKSEADLNFIRRGVVGGYKSEMSKEYADKIDKWFAETKNLNQGFNYKENIKTSN